MTDDQLGGFTDFDVISVRNGTAAETRQSVATEVPCTIVVNGNEVATIMSTPTHCREFSVGYLYTSGMINSAQEVTRFFCDEKRWRLDVTTTREIDVALLGKRLYTSGCGKGVMYSNVIMLASRHPLEFQFHVTQESVSHCVKWLLSCSSLYKETRGVHTAALSIAGELPPYYRDDIGRHNAVDKVIGRSLMDGVDFSNSILISTGRISAQNPNMSTGRSA